MRIKSALVGSFLLLSVAAPGFAQQGAGNGCTPAGVWYGGSVVAYKLTVIPQVPAGRYTVIFEGMYTNSVMRTTYSGEVEKKGDAYEGSLLALTTLDERFLISPPPLGLPMPDLLAGWMSLRMVDCNNMTNTMPFFGLYPGAGVWTPGPVWVGTKLVDAPFFDLLAALTGGQPIVESYRRFPNSRSQLQK